jgi:flagellin
MSDSDRAAANEVFQHLMQTITNIGASTNYNNMRLTDGTFGGNHGNRGLNLIGVDRSGLLDTQSGIDISNNNNRLLGDATLTVLEMDGGGFEAFLRVGDQVVRQEIDFSSGVDGAATFRFFESSADGAVEVSLRFDQDTIRAGVTSGLQIGSDFVSGERAITGTSDSRVTFQIGANGDLASRMNSGIGDMTAIGLGLFGIDILSPSNALEAQAEIDRALDAVSNQRAQIGAQTNRLGHTINNLGTSIENLSEAESRIRDADIAQEMMEFTRASLLMQTAQAMLAQASQQPSIILQMLRAMNG